MKSLEIKKNKRLGINVLIVIVFISQMLMVTGVSFSKSFAIGRFPLAYIQDSYLFISLLINPILLSSLVKKVIEIEEKNNMWKMQIILGQKVNSILINKFINLSSKLLLLQIVEGIFFLVLAMKSKQFIMDEQMILRFILVNISALLINLFFLSLFMIIEMKTKKVYTLSFLSIIGGLTGIISMLTSKVLTYINPFAWMSSLINISYVKEGSEFIQILNPINLYTPILSLSFLLVNLIYLKNTKSYNLLKD